ncbi:MAG: S8 family serine peptidase [Clostridiales Family XIII bacterium]|jgi:subtilisin family serine protease|nr:S8 family serine peptidase [Clostridiales Family XIII bacterium]
MKIFPNRKFNRISAFGLIFCLLFALNIPSSFAESTDDQYAQNISSENIDALAEDGAISSNEIILVMKDSVDEENIVSDEDTITETVEMDSDVKAIVVETEGYVGDAISEYNENPAIDYVQPNYIYSLLDDENIQTNAVGVSDPHFTNQWALQSSYKTRLRQAWNMMPSAQQVVKVAVVDTGLDITHEDLAANVIAEKAWNFVDKNTNVTDSADGQQHGTHVAGILSADTNNGKGIAGVSYNRAKIIPYKVFYKNSLGEDVTDSSKLIATYKRAINDGCKIVNMSLGGYGNDKALNKAVDDAYKRGIITVAAAGNADKSAYVFPSDFENVISVVATAKNGKRTAYSDHNKYKDIAAPGGDYGGNGDSDGILSTKPGNAYTYKCGTSMATPYISGIIALIWSSYPELSVEQIKDILYLTATDKGANGRDDYYGYGLVNAKNAMGLAGDVHLNKNVLKNVVKCKIKISATNSTTGKFNVKVSTSDSWAPVSSVRLAVWHGSNKDDLRWYKTTKNKTAFSHKVSMSKHNYKYGTYHVRVYATTSNGIEKLVSETKTKVKAPKVSMSVKLNKSKKRMTARVSNVFRLPGVTAVKFAVWGARGGQNDLRWYTDRIASDGGKYSRTIKLSEHKEKGKYFIDSYAVLANGKTVFLKSTTVKV